MIWLRRAWFATVFLAGCPEGLDSVPGDSEQPSDPSDPSAKACRGDASRLNVPLRGPVTIVPPAGVRIPFSVERCDKTPVPDLTIGGGIEVINNETGMTFGSEGSAFPEIEVNDQLATYVILVLDMSFSIAMNDPRRLGMLDGAQQIIDALLDPRSPASLRPAIAIYVFGSTADSRLEISFTKNRDRLIKVLEELRDDTRGRGSTNLYGGFVNALEALKATGKDLPKSAIVARSLVILTDGVHETGDIAKNRVEAQTALAEAEEKLNVQSFAIPITDDGVESLVERVCELATNQCLVTDAASVVMQFEHIAGVLLAGSRSNYVLGVCSPVEGPGRKLTIEAYEEHRKGDVEVDYDATDFRLTECDPRLVVSCIDGRTDDCNDDPSDGCETQVGILAQHDGIFEARSGWFASPTPSYGQIAQEITNVVAGQEGPLAAQQIFVRMESAEPSVPVTVRLHQVEADGSPGRPLIERVAQVPADCSPHRVALDLPVEPITGRLVVSVEWELMIDATGVCADSDASNGTPKTIYHRQASTQAELETAAWTRGTPRDSPPEAWLGLEVSTTCAR